MIRIALVDDHALFRKSLKLLITHFEGMEVVLEAANGVELLEKLKTTLVDVVLLDLQMPVMDGFETGKQLRALYPDLKIVVLTLLNDADSISKTLEWGADGYLTKKTDPLVLKNALETVDEAGCYLDEEVATALGALNEETVATVDFTCRELQIIQLTAQEFSAKEIAMELGISYRTVETFKNGLIQKTDSKNFMGVVLYALKHKMITF